MKVIGWTYWGNSEYIDICNEHTRIVSEITKDIPKLPNREELINMSEEEQIKALQERRIAFDRALDCDELRNIDKLIEEAYKTVINEVRENGYHFSGNDHQNADWGVPILDDKYILCVSQRCWGGIIADAFPNEIDDSDGYGYLDWAWTTSNNEKYKVPKEYVK